MDMSTKYLGLDLKNPLVAAASPLSREVSSVRQLEDAGVGAVVIHSLFQEQIEHEDAAHDHFMQLGTESFAEALSYFPAQADYRRGPEQHLDHLTAVTKAVGIPVIASLNCTSTGGWTEYAKKMQDAGADALELNIYSIATDPTIDAAAIEHRYVEILRGVKRTVRLPVSVKLTPYFSSFANFAKRLDDEGADGLVLFNRFHQPDIDLDALEVVPQVVLSAPHEMRMPLRWIAILDPLVKASLAATTGVYTSLDVLKLLMAGADATQLCAALLRDGVCTTARILDEMGTWMADHEYESVQQLQGIMNQRSCPDPAAFERGQYMKALNAYA
ncbi:MAG: dihydroorotate dehydrogenase-like protein [Phycisphaerales bacterium]|nr:MAG: dihydroorotate dehydrogenase-like protein [Phycisphaerales bacterium]